MRFSQFFIQRPIFAGVLSAIIFIAGALSLRLLPISEYPEVVPPTVVVRAMYPGANPQVIAETVASPLEQAINGVEDMLYTSSQSTADGLMTLNVTFELGTDLDQAQVLVQNRVAQALPKLPEVTQRLGVVTEKSLPDFTLVVHLVSPDKRYDMLYLSNYATLRVRDELKRIEGVGDAQVFGAGEYSMRVWLDPEKVAALNLTASDVVRAIREQNVQVAAGQLGAPPAPNAAQFQLLVDTQGRLVTEEEFEDIVVKTGERGQITRLKDVARVELGASTYALRSLLDNEPAVAIPVYQQPGSSNAIDVSNKVRAKMEELKGDFPEGVDYRIVYDPTVFVRESIGAVVETLVEALLLVVLVVVLFLRTWRASVIPLAAVPVSLVGTLAVMHLLGFSLNALSLFGLVLAIGIVVDDAIVVVENVERNIARGLSPIDAAKQAMSEVTSPIIAISAVLIAVFVPTAFISGLSGQFYEQFALTIAISTVISAINSLTLSPALAALLLKPHGAPPDRFQSGHRLRVRLGDSAVQSVLRVAVRAVRRGRGQDAQASRCRGGHLRRAPRRHVARFLERAAGLHPAAGQGVPGRVRAATRGRDARPHRGRHPPHDRHHARGARRRAFGRVPGPLRQRLRQRAERRHRIRRAARFRGSEFREDALRERDRGLAEPEVRGDPRRVHRDLPAAADPGPLARSAASRFSSRIVPVSATARSTRRRKRSSAPVGRRRGSQASSRAIRSTCRRCAPTSIATRRWRKAFR